MYHLLGKQVRVHLYSKDAIAVGVIQGRVADVAKRVEVAPGMKKDLALVVDIEIPDSQSETYTSSSGTENEGWFAIQDLQVIDDETLPGWFNN
ncbi:MAG: hypothetical protein OXE59_04875 [Bacteroidetes bacterium]|nr:hypothetical protein [Bacteroidota bacterium]MCY4233058.1 hypothetical protein [Bacteroidota bacterium]